MEIWINPACSKCRSALSVLDEAGVAYTVRRYLDDRPSTDELRAVLARLGLEPWDITRTQEPQARELGIASWPKNDAERERWIEALASTPELIQRPIITADDGTTVVGRSEEAIRTAITHSDEAGQR
jgi:arsenate reductase